jgi:hypothetical protein
MPVWLAVLIVVAVVVVGVVLWLAMRSRRTQKLQERFGPEYDRTAKDVGNKRKAEAELAAREERREQLNIRPLPSEARKRYSEQWQGVQAQFVDSPAAAVSAADGLVSSVMADRGYPMDDFDQRAADVSVDHPQVVENYRSAHEISQRASGGDATTEDLRQAMQHYRALFEELLEGGAADDGQSNGQANGQARADIRDPQRTVQR